MTQGASGHVRGLHWTFFTRRGATLGIDRSCLTVTSRIGLVGARSARGNRAAAHPSGQLRSNPVNGILRRFFSAAWRD